MRILRHQETKKMAVAIDNEKFYYVLAPVEHKNTGGVGAVADDYIEAGFELVESDSKKLAAPGHVLLCIPRKVYEEHQRAMLEADEVQQVQLHGDVARNIPGVPDGTVTLTTGDPINLEALSKEGVIAVPTEGAVREASAPVAAEEVRDTEGGKPAPARGKGGRFASAETPTIAGTE